jgi:hypothetical protein
MFQTTNVANKTATAAPDVKTETENDHGVTVFKEVTITTYTDGTIHKKTVTTPLDEAGVQITAKAKEAVEVHINDSDRWTLILLVFVQVVFVTMVYGPIAAFLVELFPTNIRYTSMSLPYHIGNGVFGGLLPAVGTYLVANAKAGGHQQWYLEGLWYPIIVAAVCFVIGVIYVSNKPRNLSE